MADARATSAQQVRDWLDTVLNPLSEAVQDEMVWLNQGRATFRHHLRDLDGILATRSIVGRRYEQNLAQIERYDDELRAHFERHDTAREALAEAARNAFDRLDEMAGPLQPDARPYLLEYTVEGINTLPHHYELRDLWTEKRPQLLDVWQREPMVAEARRALEARRAEMLQAATALEDLLRRRIESLADRHGVAPVGRVVA